MVQLLTQFDYHQTVSELPGITLVAFTAPTCGSCRHLKQVLALLTGTHPGWNVLEVDVASDPGVASEFGIFHLPALFLYLDGSYHCEILAEATVSAIESRVVQALQLPPEEEP